MSSFLSDFYPVIFFFFEIFKFKTGKCEITPKFVSRTQPVTVNFPVNRIYRPKFFSLPGARNCEGARRGRRRLQAQAQPPRDDGAQAGRQAPVPWPITARGTCRAAGESGGDETG